MFARSKLTDYYTMILVKHMHMELNFMNFCFKTCINMCGITSEIINYLCIFTILFGEYIYILYKCLFGLVVNMFDCRSRGCKVDSEIEQNNGNFLIRIREKLCLN